MSPLTTIVLLWLGFAGSHLLLSSLAVLVVDEQLPPPVLRAHSLEQLAGYATTVVLAGLAP